MTLHERITAAVEKRLAVAQAASQPHGGRWPMRMFAAALGPDIAEHIADNGPARIIRDCRRDLKVLGRHAETSSGCCINCCPGCHHFVSRCFRFHQPYSSLNILIVA